MVLKSNWEKTNEYTDVDEKIIKQAIQNACPEKTLASYSIISGGCANLNVKIRFKDSNDPFLLRLYLRDKEAALKEQNIYKMVGDKIPVPEVLCVGNTGSYRYALTNFVSGITLRDTILHENAEELSDAIYETGSLLAKLQNYTFPCSGFFDQNLKVQDRLEQNFCVDFLHECLESSTVSSELGSNLVKHIAEIADQYASYFPNNSEHTLVHADYDPSNILVNKQNGKWKVTAILDWEFAFSGSYLCDVANMLRYAHQLPDSYEQSFLQGLQDAGIKLPNNWRITIHLLNLLSLLDCLVRSDPKNRPNQCKDIKELIGHIVDQLEVS
ncbi:MAG: aminoglycoside phosphotransferase family protein [Proteobacteria bacterium]|nr:aminoglycoside phosphotransferase family protein [Pseudomonadota bacterium]